MRWMTRCTCDCSGGPAWALGGSAGFGGAACAGAACTGQAIFKRGWRGVAHLPRSSCAQLSYSLPCHKRDSMDKSCCWHAWTISKQQPSAGRHPPHQQSPLYHNVPRASVHDVSTFNAARRCTWNSKLHGTHAARAPGCFWSSAAGCALAEACRVPLANAFSCREPGAPLRRFNASYARHSKIKCDVEQAVCHSVWALLVCQAVRHVCLSSGILMFKGISLPHIICYEGNGKYVGQEWMRQL